VNGNLLPASQGDTVIPVANATYAIQMRLGNGNPMDRPSYELDVSFK
jgi:hypothetical protein